MDERHRSRVLGQEPWEYVGEHALHDLRPRDVGDLVHGEGRCVVPEPPVLGQPAEGVEPVDVLARTTTGDCASSARTASGRPAHPRSG